VDYYCSQAMHRTVRPAVACLVDRAETAACQGLFDQASALFRAAISADLTCAARLRFAVWLASREQGELAESLLRDALDLARRGASAGDRALICHNLAILQARRGDLQQAAQSRQLCLSAWLEAPPSLSAELPAWIRHGTPSPETARRLPLLRRIDDESQAALQAAVHADNVGERAAAVHFFIQALEQARAHRQGYEEAVILERLAELHEQAKRVTDAMQSWEQARRRHDQDGRFRSRQRCQQEIARLKAAEARPGFDPRRN
jgi:tetratricopeptide (TPR) repeat protein